MQTNPETELRFERWLYAARRGDGEALGRIFAHFREPLLHVAAQKLGGLLQPKIEPTDLVQDTFIEAQVSFPRFLGLTESSTYYWLRRILKNNLADLNRHFSAVKRAVSSEQRLNTTWLERLIDSDPTPGTAASQREQNSHIGIAMARLPDNYREVVRLREAENLRFAEIAVRLNKPTADAARKMYDRALLLLKQLVGEAPIDRT